MKDNTPASSPERWIIYGANGYTGELIAREAVKRGTTQSLQVEV